MIDHMGDIYEGWSELANAIVLRAVEDYRQTLAQLGNKPDDRRLWQQKRELERFFRSGWFRVLTDLNGKRLLCQLQAEPVNTEGKE